MEQKLQLEFMDDLPLLLREGGEFHSEWALENITTAFFKCTRWEVEETSDFISCPYHYFCDSTYPGDYPPIADYLVLLFAVASYLSATVFTILDLSRRRAGLSVVGRPRRRYWLPSGQVALPLILLILAKGDRINTIFPLMHLGPALLQLVQISALAFRNQTNNYFTYAVLEASTISGILHASLYLDSIVLPFYTGLDAITHSTFSGECPSCICRTDALVVGGKMILYRGWSMTMISVVSALCSRILCEIFGGERLTLIIKTMLEWISWVLIGSDSIYLMIVTPQIGVTVMAAYGGLCILISLNVLRKASSLLLWLAESRSRQKRLDLSIANVGIV